MKWLLPVSLAGVCLIWVLLSQVAFLTLGGSTSILGRDGLLAFLEEKTIDARLWVRGAIPSPTKVCYINVDTKSIVAFRNFPWSRAIFAKALDALFERGKARAVGGEAPLARVAAEPSFRALPVQRSRQQFMTVVPESVLGGAPLTWT